MPSSMRGPAHLDGVVGVDGFDNMIDALVDRKMLVFWLVGWFTDNGSVTVYCCAFMVVLERRVFVCRAGVHVRVMYAKI